MTSSTQHQSLLFFLPLAEQVALLKDDLLDAVDPLLDDPELINLVRQCLARRRPQSTRTGRPGIAPDRLLRCVVLKHMKGWSFRQLDRELCSNLMYRRFTRYDGEKTLDYTAYSRFSLCSALPAPRRSMSELCRWRARRALPRDEG